MVIRARDASLYRLAETHHETFKQVYEERFASVYGPWRAVMERTLFALLDCGIEARGFARVRCDACRREFRVALSCKKRWFWPSGHAKRAVLWAEWLAGEVLEPVPHRPWVFTVPKRLRLFFLYDRRLLGALSRCAWSTVRDLYRAGLRDPHAVPGMVVSIQTYGDLANWQPHLHALVSAGVVNRKGVFTPLALPPAGVAEELFRRRVIKMMRERGCLEDEVAAGLLAWRHSGFSVHHSIRVDPCDTEGVEPLCRSLVHAPIAVVRLRYDGTRVTYRGRRVHPLTGEASVTLDPLEMLARLCQHIPPPGMHLTRLYGTYANRTRGARARRMAGAGKKPAAPRSETDTPAPTQRERRRQWARLIAKVFEVDPLPRRRDEAGDRVHPRPGGDPEDQAASAAPWRVRGRARAPGCVRRGNTREAGSPDTPIRGRHGGACRRRSGPARSLLVWGTAIGDPADLCAPLRWPVG